MECEVCGDPLVLPSGHTQSPILMFGDSPGWEDIRDMRPWVGNAGEVLHTELTRAGIDPRMVRLTNMWMHDPKPECQPFHMQFLMRELTNRKAVMVMGATPVKYFFFPTTGKSVSEITGTVQTSTRLPSTVQVAMPMVNPGIALHGTIGEVRLAITKFAALTRELRQ